MLDRRLLIVCALAAGCAGAGAGAPASTDEAAPARSTAGPVVIELFTSQGCSSCPPADRWLSSLRRGQQVAGRAVLPLAFHVDYWNDLGWADPFSSRAWTDRQGRYARRLGGRGVYTPELVIGGVVDVIGSRRRDAERLIAAAPATATLPAHATRAGAAIEITATAPRGAVAWAAVVEDGLATAVTSGENGDHTLRNDHVVRALVRVAEAGVSGSATVPLDTGWGDVHVVVFAQDPASGAIVAARALD